MRSCEYSLVEEVITLKNVFDWTEKSRTGYDTIHNYCLWMMQVNYNTIKDKKEFFALKNGERTNVTLKAWPGEAYLKKYQRWKESHGGKKKGEKI